jgi:HAD superfamily hydrolase (TIGR01509 family)
LTICGALVLDMDGLMVDSEPLWLAVQRDFARSRGGDWPDSLAYECVGKGIAHSLRAMNAAFGLPLDLERDKERLIEAFLVRIGDLSLKPGCEGLLDAARDRDVPCAVASSSARRLVQATLARFDLTDRFGAIVTGDCVVRHKPSPDVFVEAARRLGVGAAACVVLEDSLPGVIGARAAGMQAVAVPERAPERFVGVADMVVRDLYEASDVLGFASPRLPSLCPSP